MRLILGIADVIQPHAGHALSECVALHEFLNQALVGIAGFVAEKSGHFSRGGGQAGQVEIQSAGKGTTRGFGRGCELPRVQLGQNEMIDPLAWPSAV